MCCYLPSISDHANAPHAARTLFTSETLDITQYQQNRQHAFENVEQPHRFKWELQCYIENEAEKESLHLKNAIEVLVHLIQSDMNDIDLIRKALYTYGSLPDVKEKGKRTIGNLTMSAIHSVNRADVGLQVNEIRLSITKLCPSEIAIFLQHFRTALQRCPIA